MARLAGKATVIVAALVAPVLSGVIGAEGATASRPVGSGTEAARPAPPGS